MLKNRGQPPTPGSHHGTAEDLVFRISLPPPSSKSEWSVLFIGGRYYHHERSSDLLYKTHPLLRAAPQAMLSQSRLHSSSHLVVLSLGHDCRIFFSPFENVTVTTVKQSPTRWKKIISPHHFLDFEKTSRKSRKRSRFCFYFFLSWRRGRILVCWLKSVFFFVVQTSTEYSASRGRPLNGCYKRTILISLVELIGSYPRVGCSGQEDVISSRVIGWKYFEEWNKPGTFTILENIFGWFGIRFEKDHKKSPNNQKKISMEIEV